MNESTIKRSNVSTISISGEMNDIVRAKIAQFLQLATQYKGRILRRQEFSDGVFLEILFENEETQKVWENQIGLK